MRSSKQRTLLWVSITHNLLPLILICSLVYIRNYKLSIVIPSIIMVGAMLYTLLSIGAWQYTNYYNRYVIIGVYIITSMYCMLQTKSISDDFQYEAIAVLIICLITIFVIIYDIKIYLAKKKPRNFIKLLFPFRQGKYLITNGGDGKLCKELNYHLNKASNKEKYIQNIRRYSVDVVLLDDKGRTFRTQLDDDNRNYKIFHEQIYSPCGGIIVKVVNDVKTRSPFEEVNKISRGNYIIIRKGEYEVLVGNFERNTIKVKVGDKVSVGQFIGIVGNSKTLSIPHIHIHAYKVNSKSKFKSEGIPIIFNGYFYGIKNKIIKVR